jgi:hypothetical protein
VLPARVFAGIQKRTQEGATLKIGVVSGNIGQVQANATSKFFFRCDLGDPKSCCSYRAVHGVPCRHECRLAMAMHVKIETLVAKELTCAWDKTVYAAALPVLPMDTTKLIMDRTGPPVWEGRKQRGRPRGSRIPCAIDKVSKGLVIISSHSTLAVSVDHDGPMVGPEPVENAEPDVVLVPSDPASLEGPGGISEPVEPVTVGPKKRGYVCSACNGVGHSKRSKTCPKSAS